MSGVAEAAALLGIVGFSLGLLEVSIKGLVLLSKAYYYDRDVSGVKLMIELEIHKLFAWASEAGLTQTPSTLLVDIKDAPVVPKILEYLKELVNNLDKLQSVYGIQVQQTSDQFTILDAEESASERLGIDKGNEYGNIIKRIFRRREKPWLRLRWVVVDEDKIQKMLHQIQHFIHELQAILNRAQQMRLNKTLDILLRNVVMSSADQQELNLLGLGGRILSLEQGIAAAARLKKQGLLLGLLESTQPGNGSSGSELNSSKRNQNTVLSKSQIKGQHLSTTGLSVVDYNHHETRFLARLNHCPVLLEFRNSTSAGREFITDHVGRVSAFLHHLDSSFHGLSCLGYIELHHRFAHVFDLSIYRDPSKSRHHLPSYRTLGQLLLDSTSPSLNLRFAMAITVLETLLQLHTAGWLHKELRPENILFLRTTQHRGSEDFVHADMRVTGYSYARADDLAEMTEPRRSDIDADLYRHPAYLQRPRVPFQRAFDIFSVGCILLEIGLWRPLSGLLEDMGKATGKDSVRASELLQIWQRLLVLSPVTSIPSKAKTGEAGTEENGILGKLEGCTGKAYADIVAKMIHVPITHADTESAAKMGSTSKEHGLVEMEIESLEKLRMISQIL